MVQDIFEQIIKRMNNGFNNIVIFLLIVESIFD